MSGLEKHEITTANCGKLIVHVQGDLTKLETRAVFLTVHDMGCNHSSWVEFVGHPVMREARDRSIFLHVDIPGQEDNAPDLPNDFSFPTMQQISDDLIKVIDHFKAKLVVGLAEGAGANIVTRFGLSHPDRLIGLVLVHCTSTTAGVMEHFKDKIMNWKLTNVGMNPTTEQYLIFHKFGHVEGNVQSVRRASMPCEQLDSAENKEKLIKEYQDRLQSKINPKNLRKYVDAFLKRTDLTSKLESNLKVETLLVTGAKASHVHTVHTMHQACNKTKASLLKIDDVGDVLVECPEKFAQSLLLFCKGLGILTSLPMSGIDRQRTFSGSSTDEEGRPRRQRTMSMEEYDVPNLRRFSFSAQTAT